MPITNHYDLDIDTTLGGNNASDYIIPSQKAIKAYVDNNSSGGGSTTLSGLTDVTLTSPASGQILEYDGSDWVNANSYSRNIGEIVTSTIPLTDAGLHLLDGSLINGSGSYSDFVTYIANLYENNKETLYGFTGIMSHNVFTKTLIITPSTPLYNSDGSIYNPNDYSDAFYQANNGRILILSGSVSQAIRASNLDHNIPAPYFTTEANWQTAVTTYGVCGKFVYDAVNNTVRLPKYNSKIYTGGGTAPVVGNGITLGLSNGTTNFGLVPFSTSNLTMGYSSNAYGLSTGSTYTAGGTNAGNKSLGVTTDGTKSGIIADLSNITTSLDGYYYIVVATSTKTQIQVDINEIATDLNDKADTDLSNTTPSQSFKNNSIRWGMPDYANGISLVRLTTYTCPSDGWISCAGTNSGTAAYRYVYRNGSTEVFAKYGDGTYLSSFCKPVLKDDVITISSAFYGAAYFYPMKGV